MIETIWIYLQSIIFKLYTSFGPIIAYANSVVEQETQVSDAVAITDVVNTGGRSVVGGGEVLYFLDNSSKQSWTYMNEDLINQINYIPLMRVIIMALIIISFILLVLALSGFSNGVTYAGIDAEINNINALRKQDAKVLRQTNLLATMTATVEKLGLGVDPTKKNYMEYNLKRAGKMHPNRQRTLTPAEYNAEIKTAMIVCIAVGIIVSFFSLTAGVIIAIGGIVILNIVPEIILRGEVLEKDRVIKNNFFDFYGELHYPMVTSTATEPLVKIIRNYSKVDLVPEMREFTNNVADLFDLYGEYEGSKYVAVEYKEIPEVTKLMRLIRQYNEGADVEQDMIGFRDQLLLQQQINIDKHCDKLVGKARKSFVIIYIILIQAVISAMLIYVQDLGSISSLLGS